MENFKKTELNNLFKNYYREALSHSLKKEIDLFFEVNMYNPDSNKEDAYFT